VYQSLNRAGIENWVRNTYLSPADLRLKDFKDKRKQARSPKPKKNTS
jgi:hypothetical protein